MSSLSAQRQGAPSCPPSCSGRPWQADAPRLRPTHGQPAAQLLLLRPQRGNQALQVACVSSYARYSGAASKRGGEFVAGVEPPLPHNDAETVHKCGYVALIGKPNAGKSTLLNAILQQKLSIVTRKAQTTRQRVLGISSEEDHQMIIMDTPGVIDVQSTKLDTRMMAAVRSAVEDADACVVVVDAHDRPEEVLPLVQGWKGPPMAVVLNKVDLVAAAERERLQQLFGNTPAAAVLPCSALSGGGVEDAKAWAIAQLPPGPALYDKDIVAQQPERFFVSEIVREQVFLQYHQEVPYCIAVVCADYKERPKAKDYVQVIIYVERAQQRGIVIGREGSALKRLATASRAAIEAFVGRPVYLDMSVKVKEKWRKDDKMLEQFGY